MKIVILGGGAAGFFAAITAKRKNPEADVIILEKTMQLLSKVRISGGGRCNVTHHCFDPKELCKNYPRGGRELLGPFHFFGPKDTVAFFEERKVFLKAEEDGRMFPISDSSEDIIDCLVKEAQDLGVEIRLKAAIHVIEAREEGFYIFLGEDSIVADALLLATGSNKMGYEIAKSFAHTVQEPVPSLFTLNIPKFALEELSGVVAPNAEVHVKDRKVTQKGPLLITHFGFSGPAALKLSAWEARFFCEKNYQVTLLVNWTGKSSKQVYEELLSLKKEHSLKSLYSIALFDLPKNLWKLLLEKAGFVKEEVLNRSSDKKLQLLAEKLTKDAYHIEGKTTNKSEFVTCGGVTLSEVNFKTMESKVCKNLFFAGEVLDIDAVTGGFNFQSAWTTGYLAGISMGSLVK